MATPSEKGSENWKAFDGRAQLESNRATLYKVKAREIVLPCELHVQSCQESENDTCGKRSGLSLRVGIIYTEGNVLGMMPHPERCAEAVLGNEDGRLIMASMVDGLRKVKIGAKTIVV